MVGDAKLCTWEGVVAGSITTVEVDDPYEITPTMWELFTPTPTSAMSPPQFLARTYRAGDWRRYKLEKDAYKTTVSVGKLGRTCFVRMADREAIDMVVGPPGIDHYCLTFMNEGQGLLSQPCAASPADIEAGGGVIFHARPGTVLKTGRQAVKTNVWIPAGLLRRQAAEMLDSPELDALEFKARIDTSTAAGAGLRRLTEWLYDELAHPDSPLSNPIASASAQDLFLRTIVLAATHEGSAQLRDQARPAAPATVRRAEAFMRCMAQGPLAVEDIANAAGCSVRALQAAFRCFRGTSPMAVLRRIRLELAHQDIMRSDGSISVGDIAARYGFSNPGRFASQYRRVFGEYPSRITTSRIPRS
jgi:AraC-like DNA-binding protein